MRVDLQKQIHEIETIYDELAFHLHYIDEANNGKAIPSTVSAFNVLKKIELFIAILIAKKSPLFRVKYVERFPRGNDPLCNDYFPTPMAREFAPFDFILSHSDSPIHRINLVQKNYMDLLNLHYQQNSLNSLLTGELSKELVSLNKQQLYFINNFSEELRVKFNDPVLDKSLSHASNQLNQKFKNYSKYIDELFQEYNSLTFLCMEFSLFDQTNPNLIHDLKKTFFNNGRSNKGLSDMVGYIGKWEFSKLKGYYFRAVFIFPSETVVHSKTLSIQISDYWIEDVTNGNGICHHAMLAAKTLKLKKHSCTIDVSDKKNVDSFKDRVVAYITKSEKFYMPDELTSFLLAGKTAAKSSDKKERNSHNTTFKGTFKPKNTE